MTAALDLAAVDLAGLGDQVLTALYDAAGSDEARAAILEELDRQEQDRRGEVPAAAPAPAEVPAPARPAWRDTPAGHAYSAIGAEWYDAAHADYLGAEEQTRGNLTAPGAPPRDPFPWLWQCSAREFDRHASEELQAWREQHPFPNLAEYRRQQAAIARDARAEAEDQDPSPSPSPVWRELAEATPTPRRSTRAERDAAAADTQRRREELRARMASRAAERAQGEALRVAAMGCTPYSTIQGIPTQWLWPGRAPFGEVALLAGEGGVGKGLALADLAARVSRGAPMPGQDGPGIRGNVIMITPEDDLNETVVFRLRAAGADLGRIHDLTMLPSGTPFELPEHIAMLRAAMDAIGEVALVVIDPLLAVCSRPVSTNLGARRVVAPLQRLAKEAGAAVLVSHHTVKSGAIAGSKGLTDAARIVHTIRRDPEHQALRVLATWKANVTADTSDARYSIAGDGLDARVAWLTRDDVLGRRASVRAAREGRPLWKAAG